MNEIKEEIKKLADKKCKEYRGDIPRHQIEKIIRDGLIDLLISDGEFAGISLAMYIDDEIENQISSQDKGSCFFTP